MSNQLRSLTPAELQVLIRNHFPTFIERCFMELNPQTQYLYNWHIEVMAAKLEECRQGKVKRLIINLPPRGLKSLCASIAFPAFILGHTPSAQIVCASYGQDLSDKLALDCRSIMQTEWYQSIFKSTRISSNKRSISDFMTDAKGFRMATSVGGVLTGRGADIIIIDDPMKPDEALSETTRKAANNWFDNTLYSRLNDKQSGCIIIIMQRLHLDDLVGHVLEQEKWEVLSFPAIAEQDEVHRIYSPFGNQEFHRKTGEALHPARESLETLSAIKQTIGEFHFSGQYQQSPVPMGGGYVKLDWLRYYEPHELPTSFEHILQSWDTANKESELADFSVCTTWGIKDKKVYLLDVFRKKMNYPELKRKAIDLARLYKPNSILIEDKASGTQLIQELIHEGVSVVKAYKSSQNKLMRMHAQTGSFENGIVLLPAKAHWKDSYVLELISFPTAKHDDQVDSTSQALECINLTLHEPGILTYYRQLYEQQQRELGRPGY